MPADRIWEHALLGGLWLRHEQKADGSWARLVDPKVEAFYKCSWAAMMTGQPIVAHRALNYARAHFFNAEGDFVPRGNAYHRQAHHPYANAYFVIGSLLTGRYDIFPAALAFLASQQDPETGGMFTRHTEPGQRDRSNAMASGAAGVAFLAAGQIERAEGIADFLDKLVVMQPAPGEKFYTTLEADGSLGTTPEEDDGEMWWRVVDTCVENQCWYALGLPLAFMVQMYEFTKDKQYLARAFWFFRFLAKCVNPWHGPSSGKAGWASAMLFRITGEPLYREKALTVADYLISLQNPEGNWTWSTLRQGYADAEDAGLTDSDLDLTSEYTLWLALIATNLAAGGSR